MSLEVEVNYADGTRQSHTFTQDRVLVGRGERADLDVRLAPEIDEEHLLLIPRRNGCWVAAAAHVRVQPMYGGKPFEHGLLPWGAELDVGSVTITVRPGAAEKRSVSLWYVVALLPLAATAVLLWPQDNRFAGTPVSPPELTMPAAPPKCPADEPASVQARRKNLEAAALEARYPYKPQEGFRATRAWLQAAVCFAEAQQESLAKNARTRAAKMMDRLGEDYKAQRLVVEQARRREDYPQILGALRILKQFVAEHPGAYLDYLGRLERQVIVNMEKKNKHIKYAP